MDYVCLKPRKNHSDLSEKPVDQPTKLADLLEKPLSPPENCTLNEIMRTLGERGCTSSLHTVQTEDEWHDLLDSLYLMVPDVDDASIRVPEVSETTKAKAPGRQPVTNIKKGGGNTSRIRKHKENDDVTSLTGIKVGFELCGCASLSLSRVNGIARRFWKRGDALVDKHLVGEEMWFWRCV